MRVGRTATWMAVLALAAAHATTARASDTRGASTQDGGPERSPEWYGWQTIGADMAAAAIVTAGVAEDEPALFWPGLGAFVLATPAVHLAHGNTGAMWTSLGLRIAAPLLLGLAGGGLAAAGSSSDDDSRGSRTTLVQAGPGLLLGGLLATIVDAKILAEEPTPDEEDARLLPRLAIHATGAHLGVAGRF